MNTTQNEGLIVHLNVRVIFLPLQLVQCHASVTLRVELVATSLTSRVRIGVATKIYEVDFFFEQRKILLLPTKHEWCHERRIYRIPPETRNAAESSSMSAEKRCCVIYFQKKATKLLLTNAPRTVREACLSPSVNATASKPHWKTKRRRRS